MKSLIIICVMGLISIFDCKVDDGEQSVKGCGNAVDVDGNIYKTVSIGGKCWLAENYKVNYAGSRVYDDIEANRNLFGGLYNTAMMKAADFAIPGWHVTTKLDWEDLYSFMGFTYAQYGGWQPIGTIESTWLKSVLTDGAIGHTPPNWFQSDNQMYRGIDKYGLCLLPAGMYDYTGYNNKGTKTWFLGLYDSAGSQFDIEVHATDGALSLSALAVETFVSVRLVKN